MRIFLFVYVLFFLIDFTLVGRQGLCVCLAGKPLVNRDHNIPWIVEGLLHHVTEDYTFSSTLCLPESYGRIPRPTPRRNDGFSCKAYRVLRPSRSILRNIRLSRRTTTTRLSTKSVSIAVGDYAHGSPQTFLFDGLHGPPLQWKWASHKTYSSDVRTTVQHDSRSLPQNETYERLCGRQPGLKMLRLQFPFTSLDFCVGEAQAYDTPWSTRVKRAGSMVPLQAAPWSCTASPRIAVGFAETNVSTQHDVRESQDTKAAHSRLFLLHPPRQPQLGSSTIAPRPSHLIPVPPRSSRVTWMDHGHSMMITRVSLSTQVPPSRLTTPRLLLPQRTQHRVPRVTRLYALRFPLPHHVELRRHTLTSLQHPLLEPCYCLSRNPYPLSLMRRQNREAQLLETTPEKNKAILLPRDQRIHNRVLPGKRLLKPYYLHFLRVVHLDTRPSPPLYLPHTGVECYQRIPGNTQHSSTESAHLESTATESIHAQRGEAHFAETTCFPTLSFLCQAAAVEPTHIQYRPFLFYSIHHFRPKIYGLPTVTLKPTYSNRINAEGQQLVLTGFRWKRCKEYHMDLTSSQVGDDRTIEAPSIVFPSRTHQTTQSLRISVISTPFPFTQLHISFSPPFVTIYPRTQKKSQLKDVHLSVFQCHIKLCRSVDAMKRQWTLNSFGKHKSLLSESLVTGYTLSVIQFCVLNLPQHRPRAQCLEEMRRVCIYTAQLHSTHVLFDLWTNCYFDRVNTKVNLLSSWQSVQDVERCIKTFVVSHDERYGVADTREGEEYRLCELFCRSRELTSQSSSPSILGFHAVEPRRSKSIPSWPGSFEPSHLHGGHARARALDFPERKHIYPTTMAYDRVSLCVFHTQTFPRGTLKCQLWKLNGGEKTAGVQYQWGGAYGEDQVVWRTRPQQGETVCNQCYLKLVCVRHAFPHESHGTTSSIEIRRAAKRYFEKEQHTTRLYNPRTLYSIRFYVPAIEPDALKPKPYEPFVRNTQPLLLKAFHSSPRPFDQPTLLLSFQQYPKQATHVGKPTRETPLLYTATRHDCHGHSEHRLLKGMATHRLITWILHKFLHTVGFFQTNLIRAEQHLLEQSKRVVDTYGVAFDFVESWFLGSSSGDSKSDVVNLQTFYSVNIQRNTCQHSGMYGAQVDRHSFPANVIFMEGSLDVDRTLNHHLADTHALKTTTFPLYCYIPYGTDRGVCRMLQYVLRIRAKTCRILGDWCAGVLRWMSTLMCNCNVHLQLLNMSQRRIWGGQGYRGGGQGDIWGGQGDIWGGQGDIWGGQGDIWGGQGMKQRRVYLRQLQSYEGEDRDKNQQEFHVTTLPHRQEVRVGQGNETEGLSRQVSSCPFLWGNVFINTTPFRSPSSHKSNNTLNINVIYPMNSDRSQKLQTVVRGLDLVRTRGQDRQQTDNSVSLFNVFHRNINLDAMRRRLKPERAELAFKNDNRAQSKGVPNGTVVTQGLRRRFLQSERLKTSDKENATLGGAVTKEVEKRRGSTHLVQNDAFHGLPLKNGASSNDTLTIDQAQNNATHTMMTRSSLGEVEETVSRERNHIKEKRLVEAQFSEMPVHPDVGDTHPLDMRNTSPTGHPAYVDYMKLNETTLRTGDRKGTELKGDTVENYSTLESQLVVNDSPPNKYNVTLHNKAPDETLQDAKPGWKDVFSPFSNEPQHSYPIRTSISTTASQQNSQDSNEHHKNESHPNNDTICLLGQLHHVEYHKVFQKVISIRVNLKRDLEDCKLQKEPPIALAFMNAESQALDLSNTERVRGLLRIAVEDTLISIMEGLRGSPRDVEIKRRFGTHPFVDVMKLCIVAVDQTPSLFNLLEVYFRCVPYRIPGIALMSASSPLFLKLATMYEMFESTVITPRSLPHEAFVNAYPNIISFSPLGTDQANVFLDLCLFMGWRRTVVVGTLATESIYLVNAFLRLAVAKHINVHTVRANFGLDTVTSVPSKLNANHSTCWAPAYEIENLSKSLSSAFSVLDYSIFLFAVDQFCFHNILTALQLAKLDTKKRVALIFSHGVLSLFPPAQEYLYGFQHPTPQRIYDFTKGWFFVLPGCPQAWKMANLALQHRVHMDNSEWIVSSNDTKFFGFYEILLYDVVRATVQSIILEVTNLDIDCLPHRLFMQDLAQQRTPYAIKQNFLNIQHQILFNRRTVYDSYCFVKTHSTPLQRLVRPPLGSTVEDWLVFDSLMGHIVISPHGTDVPRFGLFNVGVNELVGNKNGSVDALVIDTHAIAVWDYQLNLRNASASTYRNSLARHLLFMGDSIVTRLPELMNDYYHNTTSPKKVYENLPSPITISDDQLLLSRLPYKIYFPGSHIVPKDCVFCDKDAPLRSIMYCKVCEEDRLHIHALLLYLMRHNPNLFSHRSFVKNDLTLYSLKQSSTPTERSICELWPLIIRCTSPVTYVLYLDGLDLRGPLPGSIGHLKHVEELRLSRNYFEGPLPSFSPSLCRPGIPELPSLANILHPSVTASIEMNKLKGVYLSRNLFNGSIPEDWEHCSALRVLYLNKNQVQGPLPLSLCHISTLTDVDLSHNRITGPLPSCIGHNVHRNKLSRTTQGWKSLIHLNVQDNNFVGMIPHTFERLTGLVTLNMKKNKLEGIIPDIWDKMPPGLSIDITDNVHLRIPLPPSLIRRILFRPENVLLDPHLYECPQGHIAPVSLLSKEMTLARKVASPLFISLNLSQLCIPCPKGNWFSTETHNVMPSTGTTATKDARECTFCNAGTIAQSIASSNCTKCHPGTFSTEGSDVCSLCRPGYYSYLEGSSMCHPCPSHHFAEGYGSSFCILCPNGANCTTPKQKASPEAARGWYRITHHQPSPSYDAHNWRRFLYTESDTDSIIPSSMMAVYSEIQYTKPNITFPLIRSSSFSAHLDETQVYKALGLYECPIRSHCLGSNVCSNLSLGTFCHQCVAGHRIVSWKSECRVCPKGLLAWIQLLSLPFFAVLAFIVVFHILRSTGSHASTVNRTGFGSRVYNNKLLTDFNKYNAVILKIFTSWVELNGQALTYAIQVSLGNEKMAGSDVSSQVEGIYEFIQNLDDPFFFLFPLECVLPHWAPEPLHCGLILGIIFPACVFCVVCVWQYRFRWFSAFFDCCLGSHHNRRSLYDVFHRAPKPTSSHPTTQSTEQPRQTHSSSRRVLSCDSSDPWSRTVGVFTVVFFLIHPAVTRQFLKNLNCVQVDVPRVKQNYSLVCTMPPHTTYVRLAWAGLSGWTFGLPLLFVFNLYRHRHCLQSPKVLAQWGFLLDGYESRYYCWEIWAMLRKVLMDIPPVIPFLKENLQYLSMLTLAIISLVAHVSAEPFDNRFYKIADHMETYNLWTFLLTLITVFIHQGLNESKGCSFCPTISRWILGVTVVVSSVSLGWCVVFYLRPFLEPYFYSHVSIPVPIPVPGCKNDDAIPQTPEDHEFLTVASPKLKHSQPLNSVPDACFNPNTLKNNTYLHTSLCRCQNLHMSRHNSGVKHIPCTCTQLPALPLSAYFNPSRRIAIHHTAYHSLYDMVKHKIGGTVLRFHTARIYLTYPHHFLDMSELSYKERKFFQEVVIQDLITAQYRLHPQLLDSHFICSTIARIFRSRAFALHVTYTKHVLLRLRRESYKRPTPFWHRSFSKNYTTPLGSILSAIEAAAKSPYLPICGYMPKALHQRVSSTLSNDKLQYGKNTGEYPTPSPTASESHTQNSLSLPPLSKSNKLCSMCLPSLLNRQTAFHDLNNGGSTYLNQHPSTVESKELCNAQLSTTHVSSQRPSLSNNHLDNESFWQLDSASFSFDASETVYRFRKKNNGFGIGPKSQSHSVWKKVVNQIIWKRRFIDAIRNIAQAVDHESTQYGWTVEELQETIHNLTMSLYRSTQR